MSKARNWIIGGALIVFVVKLFGEDKPPSISTPPPQIPQSYNQLAEGLGLIQKPSSSQRPVTPPPTVEKHPYIGKRIYVTSRVNMRTEPNTASPIIAKIEAGQFVQVLNHRSDWFSISYRNRTGWVYSRYISEKSPKPVNQNSERPRAPSPPPATARVPLQNRSGQAVRQPYSGTCDCPYDYARNGSRCGGRSAYSRPGGRSPICYY